MKNLVFLLLASVLLVLTGCMNSETVISIEKNGSGTITQTVIFDEDKKKNRSGEFPEAKRAVYEALTAEMGSGVELDKAEYINEDGKYGTLIVYKFKDINKLRFSTQHLFGESAKDKPEDSFLTFKLRNKKKISQLLIRIPKEEEKEAKKGEAAAAKSEDTKTEEQKLQEKELMKQVFTGLRIALLIDVGTEIRKTSASIVDKKAGIITIYDMNYGELVNDDEGFELFMALEENEKQNTEKLLEFDSMKMEPKEKIKVLF